MSARNPVNACDPTAWRLDLTEVFAADVLAVVGEFRSPDGHDTRAPLVRAAEAVEHAYETLMHPSPARRSMAQRIVRMAEREGLNLLCLPPS